MAVIILLCTLAAISIVVWTCDDPVEKKPEKGEKTNSEKYAEKLEDPRWKAKRLEIIKRDNCTCQ